MSTTFLLWYNFLQWIGCIRKDYCYARSPCLLHRRRKSQYLSALCYARKRASSQWRAISYFLWEGKYAQRLTCSRKGSQGPEYDAKTRESDGSSKPERLSGQSRHGES